jgi:hypothetical protein
VSALDADGGPRPYALAKYNLGVPLLRGTSFSPDFRVASITNLGGLEQLACGDTLALPVFRENNYEFEADVKCLRGSAYLFGFWQSWRYFDEISRTLRIRLTIPPTSDPPDGSNDSSVAVHVRRGDYLLPSYLDSLGICELAYYRSAMSMLRDRITAPHFYVFSDEPEWCEQTFSAHDVTIVSARKSDVRDDLAKMALCRHYILANSSLSWWAAWLGAKKRSIVIAPVPWYTQSPRASDLIPQEWIRLNRANGLQGCRGSQKIGVEKISVIILAKNDLQSLLRAIDSVRAQSVEDIELIVAASSPIFESSDVKQQIMARDPRILVARPSGRGDGFALNAALAMTSGEWVAFLEDSDTWLPEKLRIQTEAAHLTGADAVSCRTIPIEGPSGKPQIYPPPGPPDCSLEAFIQLGYFVSGISHLLVRRKVLREIAPFDGSWISNSECDQLHYILRRRRAVMLWERLLRSPTPYLARSATRVLTDPPL